MCIQAQPNACTHARSSIHSEAVMQSCLTSIRSVKHLGGTLYINSTTCTTCTMCAVPLDHVLGHIGCVRAHGCDQRRVRHMFARDIRKLCLVCHCLPPTIVSPSGSMIASQHLSATGHTKNDPSRCSASAWSLPVQCIDKNNHSPDVLCHNRPCGIHAQCIRAVCVHLDRTSGPIKPVTPGLTPAVLYACCLKSNASPGWRTLPGGPSS